MFCCVKMITQHMQPVSLPKLVIILTEFAKMIQNTQKIKMNSKWFYFCFLNLIDVVISHDHEVKRQKS